MIIPYTGFPSQLTGIVYRPYINIKIFLGSRSFFANGLLDTGNDRTLINKQIGKQLGVDFKACKMVSTTGIEGRAQPTWESIIDMEIPGLTGRLKKVRVSYIASSSVGILLGHIGFFEFFTVNFDTANIQFDIIPKSNIPLP